MYVCMEHGDYTADCCPDCLDDLSHDRRMHALSRVVVACFILAIVYVLI